MSEVANASIEPNPNLMRLPRDPFNPESPTNAIMQFRCRHRIASLQWTKLHYYSQEVAPGLRCERLPPILRCVINNLVCIETVSF